MNPQPDERRSRGERSREAIVRAALEVMGERGAEGFTARNVAARAGVSPANLFHHFGSLDGLMLEAIMRMLDEAVIAPMEGGWTDLNAFLRAMGDNALRMTREQPQAINLSSTLFGKVPFDERLRRKAVEHYERYVAWVEGELERLGVGAGRPGVRRHLALALLMLLDGMSIHWSIHHDLETLERFWADVADFVAGRAAAAGEAH